MCTTLKAMVGSSRGCSITCDVFKIVTSAICGSQTEVHLFTFRGHPACTSHTAAAAAVAGGSGSSPGGTGGRQLVHSSYYQQRQPQNKHVPMLPGLHVSMEMDVDIPR
jgi:hypothetical protein